MPRSPQQNRQLREESVRRLLAAARTVFVRLGYDRATIRDIAREAGVAQGLLYNYFRSKDDLLREVFHAGIRDVGEALAAGTEADTPAEELEQVIRRSFEIVRERREFWLLSHMLRFQPRTAELTDALSAWTADVRARFEVLLRRVGHHDAPALSLVLFAAIDGAAQHYALDPERYPLEPVIDCLVRHVCRPPVMLVRETPRHAAPAAARHVRSAADSPRPQATAKRGTPRGRGRGH